MINGVRTRDIQDHNLALYQLSYDHRVSRFSTRTDASPQRCKHVAARDVLEPVRSLGFALVLVVGVGVHEAQAKPLPPEDVHGDQHPPSGIGASAVLGWASDGWMARLEYELLPVMWPHGTVGPIVGLVGGLEYWRDEDDQGFSLPLVLTTGIRAYAMRAMLGIGVHALTIDNVAGDTGVGVFGPIAMATVGLDVWGVRVGVDVRATRRWQFGADDFTQLQLGISVGYTYGRSARAVRPDPKREKPYY